MRIGIDARLAGQQHAGIGRYTKQLIQHLIAEKTDDEWVLFFYDKAQANEILPAKNLKHVTTVLMPIRHYSVAEQLTGHRYFKKYNLDLLHVPHFNLPFLYIGPTIVTIHDLLWHRRRGLEATTLPAWQYWTKYIAYRFISENAIRKAKRILVPSKAVKNEITTIVNTDPNKIFVTYEGASVTKNKLAKTEVNTKQLLYVGSLYPHKNVELILRALQDLPEHQLLIVSSRSQFSEKVLAMAKKHKVSKQVSIKHQVTDAELAKLYQSSLALVQPSLSEGFGLTGLEAMQYQGAVIASDIPTFHEIYGQAAMYVDPHNHDQLTQAVLQLSPSKRKHLVTIGAEQAKKYSWATMAHETYEQYQASIKQ